MQSYFYVTVCSLSKQYFVDRGDNKFNITSTTTQEIFILFILFPVDVTVFNETLFCIVFAL